VVQDGSMVVLRYGMGMVVQYVVRYVVRYGGTVVLRYGTTVRYVGTVVLVFSVRYMMWRFGSRARWPGEAAQLVWAHVRLV